MNIIRKHGEIKKISKQKNNYEMVFLPFSFLLISLPQFGISFLFSGGAIFLSHYNKIFENL